MDAPQLPSAKSVESLLRGERGGLVNVIGDYTARTGIIAGALLIAKVPARTALKHALIASLAIEVFVFAFEISHGGAQS